MNLSVHISGFGQMFGVPNAVVDQYLKLATPSQLKVLLYLLRSNRPNLAHDEIAKALGIPEELAGGLGYFGIRNERTSGIAEPCTDTAPFGYSGIPAKVDRR